jgi:hypothetical protein
MSDPVTLENILWYGFFTTDLTVTQPKSITTTPSNFAYEVTNASGNLGITTNIYLQDTSVSGSNISSSFLINTDYSNKPILPTFTTSTTIPSNNGNYITYNNNVILNTLQYQDINSSGILVTYPASSFYFNISTNDINLSDFIKKYKYIEFPDTNFTIEPVQYYIGTSTNKVQINMGLGNIDAGWVNNTNIIYNPYLSNLYNNYTSYGNSSACGWIIFSSNY